VHLKVDTGMGRLGVAPDEAVALARAIVAGGLRLAGTYTHFSSSDSDEALTRAQHERFEAVLAELRAAGIEPGLRHAGNSGAALRHPDLALDAVRVGIALYGCEHPGLEPALALRALVTQVKTIAAGATVGYGATWRAGRPSRVATVSLGYADGVHRARANRGHALIRGRRAPLIGRVSMDATTFDVTDIEGVAVGDTATFIGPDGGERIRAEEVAEWCGTISYEVLTSIGPRVERHHPE
jgi:alanine racemase